MRLSRYPELEDLSCEHHQTNSSTQCSPLSVVGLQRGSFLIGREVQSVATPAAILCHKEPAAQTTPQNSPRQGVENLANSSTPASYARNQFCPQISYISIKSRYFNSRVISAERVDQSESRADRVTAASQWGAGMMVVKHNCIKS